MIPTDHQLHILRHALGLDDQGHGAAYRNHFVAGGEDVAHCRTLVAAGWMRECPSSLLTDGAPWFQVTESGRAIVVLQRQALAHLTPGQRRYLAWLDADSGEPFGVWLRRAGGQARRAEGGGA